MKNRVVVTGMGAVTPLGNNVHDTWSGVKEGRNGIDFITHFDTTDHKVTIAAEVKDFSFEGVIDRKEARRMDRFCQFGMVAANEAWEQSGLGESDIDATELAVIASAGVGGMITWEAQHNNLIGKGPNKVSPFMIPMIIPNLLAGNIAIKFGAKGTCQCPVTACSSGADSIGQAFHLIKNGYAKAAITGGAEAVITPFAIAGFANMTALSTRNDPNFSSTPFDKSRDGFVMGEGAGMLVLEEYEHAKARGANILGEILGYGATCDAFHITLPDPEVDGAIRAMRMAVEEGGVEKTSIDYINAHGTSTPPNDRGETRAIKELFDDHAYNLSVSSTKSMTGHMLGAAGAVEAIISLNALIDGILPPTINLREPDEGMDLDYVANKAREKELNYAMSNSLGFGGHNACLLFKKIF